MYCTGGAQLLTLLGIATLNPQPPTLIPQPSTSTLKPQPSTLNPQPSTLNAGSDWAGDRPEGVGQGCLGPHLRGLRPAPLLGTSPEAGPSTLRRAYQSRDGPIRPEAGLS